MSDSMFNAEGTVPTSGESRSVRMFRESSDSLAESIIADAHKQGIFVHDSPELLALLAKLDTDQALPDELYLVASEVLVWLLDLDYQKKGTADSILSN